MRGMVHSVFSSSLNVELAGKLVCLEPRSRPLSWAGLAIPNDVLSALVRSARRGDGVTMRAGILQVETRDLTVRVRLATLERVPLSVRGVCTASECLVALGGQLRRRSLRARSGLAGDAAFEEASRVLVSSRSTRLDLAHAVDSIIGRGPGLTPTGDDVLVGCCAGLWALGCADEFVGLLPLERGRTTDVSRSQLVAVSQGCVSEALFRVIRLAAGGAPITGLERALSTAEATGHTSGVDALLGLELACARAEAFGADYRPCAVVGW